MFLIILFPIRPSDQNKAPSIAGNRAFYKKEVFILPDLDHFKPLDRHLFGPHMRRESFVLSDA